MQSFISKGRSAHIKASSSDLTAVRLAHGGAPAPAGNSLPAAFNAALGNKAAAPQIDGTNRAEVKPFAPQALKGRTAVRPKTAATAKNANAPRKGHK